MKLPKTLLAAIAVGIVVQTASSCSKDKEQPKPKKDEAKKEQVTTLPENCPACGMG